MPTIRSLFATLFVQVEITGRLIRSLFSTLNVDTYHYVLPSKPTFVELKARQSLTSSLLGRTVTTLFWSQDQIYNFVIDNFGKVEFGLPLFLRYAPLSNIQALNIYEVVNNDPIGSSTILSTNALLRNDLIYVANSGILNVDDFIRIGNLSSDYFIAKIKSINGGEIELYSPFGKNIIAGEEVKKVDVVQRINGIDYTSDLISGEINLLPGNIILNNKLIAEYVAELDVEYFSLYIAEGDNVIPITQGFSDLDYNTIITHPSTIEINDEIFATNTAYADVLSSSQNGKTFTYYLFAKDNKGRASYARTIVFESIPSVPQGIYARIDDEAVVLDWDALPNQGDQNTDGFNVFRCDGDVFIPANAVQVNSDVINAATPTFIDSIANVINRNDLVPFPQNNVYYTYKVESEDTLTSWVIGTQNELGLIPENEFARK